MKIILAILGAIGGFYIASYIQSDIPMLAAILGDGGSPEWLGRGSMPSGMLPFCGIVLGGLGGSILGDIISKNN